MVVLIFLTGVVLLCVSCSCFVFGEYNRQRKLRSPKTVIRLCFVGGLFHRTLAERVVSEIADSCFFFVLVGAGARGGGVTVGVGVCAIRP